MATGDLKDIISRLKAVIPPWFPSAAPIVNGLLTGFATNASWVYALYQYAKLQTRIQSATGIFIDLIAWDYLGPTFGRRSGESDASYKSRVLAFLLLPKNTVDGITNMLIALTGRNPAVLEPAIGTGGWDIATAFAYDSCGCYSGSSLMITAFRPPGQGIPNVNGYDGSIGGYDVGSWEFADLGAITGPVTDAEITMRVRQWVAAGVNYTLTISS